MKPNETHVILIEVKMDVCFFSFARKKEKKNMDVVLSIISSESIIWSYCLLRYCLRPYGGISVHYWTLPCRLASFIGSIGNSKQSGNKLLMDRMTPFFSFWVRGWPDLGLKIYRYFDTVSSFIEFVCVMSNTWDSQLSPSFYWKRWCGTHDPQ